MDHRIGKVLSVLETNLHAEQSVLEMARSVNLSVSRFQHLFKAEMGMCVSEYLLRLRMQMARRLLETTDLSVKQIALGVGAHDLSHFIKNFRRFTGHTPKRYREFFHSEAALSAGAGLKGTPTRAAAGADK
jgi:AraC family transcriptional regulator of arabinose operon